MNLHRHAINMAAAGASYADSSSRSSSMLSMNSNVNNRVVVVGLNGALQKRFVLPDNGSRSRLVPGNVHRAASVDFGVGGKGQDAAIALHCLLKREEQEKITSTNIRLVQFLGNGFAGDTVCAMLRERLGEAATEFTTVRTRSELRTCTSIVAADETTELVEPSGEIASDELGELLALFDRDTVDSNDNSNSADTATTKARSLCIMGSMPPGCPEDTYARLYQQIAGPNTVCVVDSLAGISPLLQIVLAQNGSTCTARAAGPLVLKLNASELCKLAGTSKQSSETGGITLVELIDAIEGFLKKHSVAVTIHNDYEFATATTSGVVGLAITDGKHDAYFVSILEKKKKNNNQAAPSFQILRFSVPNLENDETPGTLYPIGAGDAVAAGTVGAWTSLATSDAAITGTSSSTKTSSTPASLLPPILPKESLELLEGLAEVVHKDCDFSPALTSRVYAHAAAAFAFGLACGSASCLQEENSVLDVRDVNRLFRSMIDCYSFDGSIRQHA